MPRKRSPLDHLLQTDHEPVDGPMPYSDSSREDRSNQRHSVVIGARLLLTGGNEDMPIHVSDISQSGITFEGAAQIAIGQRYLIALPGLRPRAIDIVWFKHGRAGACFADLLPRARLDRLLSRHNET